MRHILFFISASLIFFACSSEKKSDQLKENIQTGQPGGKERDNFSGNATMVYRVPTPIEFFVFFKNAGGKYQDDSLLSVDAAGKYLTSKEKAVAFGIYASNLAYSAVFNQNQNTISYFETGKKLADDLGLTEGYGEDLMNRFQKNLNNVDSLYNLTADSYWNIFKLLEDQDKTKVLSYITIAGWVESLYQAYGSISQFEQNEIIHSLADQQYVVENLYAFVNEIHLKNAQTDEVLSIVEDLLKAYELLYENGDDVIMTETQFNTIKKVVNQKRELLVK
jgi:hypothetical protein